MERLYYQRKDQLNPRERVAVSYSLAHNGRTPDESLIGSLELLNCVETVTLLRSLDLGGKLTHEHLKLCLRKLKSVQREFNALDVADIIQIYLKHHYLEEPFEAMIRESYAAVKRHINDICLEKIWLHVPESLNAGRLQIGFVEDVVTTISILRKGGNMGEVIWHKIKPTFKGIDNLELRVRLEKIY